MRDLIDIVKLTEGATPTGEAQEDNAMTREHKTMTDRERLEICVTALLQITMSQPRPKRNGNYDLHDVQVPRFLARGALRKITYS